MKKNVLALGIATLVGGLGFSGSAFAQLNVADSGAGHILLTPYYNAQDGNMSILHLTNTDTENGKAVKVRFRGASNSDDVLDFQVFLSPGDVWTGIVTKNAATGLANLVTADNSCTIPEIASVADGGQDFITTRLERAGWSEEDKAKQTLEGYVEILNMADVPVSTEKNSLYVATKHVSGKAPCTSTVLNATTELRRNAARGWNEAAQAYSLKVGATRNSFNDMVAPTGGLTGQWYILNLEDNTSFSGVMTAITATTDTLNVFSPQLEEKAELVSADPLMQGNHTYPESGKTVTRVKPWVEPQMYDVPDLSTPYVAGLNPLAPADAATQATDLTAALYKTAIINQYANEAVLQAKTDWVFSMPTRRYTIAANYQGNVGNNEKYKVISNGAAADNLFADRAKTTVNAEGQICLASAGTTFWDREENTFTDPAKKPVFSPSRPGTPDVFDMCGEVSVLAFQDDSAVNAQLTRKVVSAGYENGWGTIAFEGNVPVLGSALVKLSNANDVTATGAMANYGLTWQHSYNK